MFVSVYMYIFCAYYFYELQCAYSTLCIMHVLYVQDTYTIAHMHNIFICIYVCVYVQNADKYVLVRKYSVLYICVHFIV